MDLLSNLVIVALFSLHQYVPREKMNEKYFESTVHSENLELSVNDPRLIVASAHETCRYFFGLGQKDLGKDENEFGNFILGLIEQKSSSLEQFGTTYDNLTKTIRNVCGPELKWSAFPQQKLAQIQEFVKQEMLVLHKNDLLRFGQMDAFGKTTLYDRNGTLLGSIYPNMDRWASYAEISPNIPKALIAAEDKGFFLHQGVELGSMSRILFQFSSSEDDSVSGGSTLTMQLLKNFYFLEMGYKETTFPGSDTYRAKSIIRKVREWFWAKPFEEFLSLQFDSSKEKILEYYLNLMDYGPGMRGIGQATQVFFKKTPSNIDIAEAAFLATLFKNPYRYSLPKNYEKYTMDRRQYVLTEMSKLSWDESFMDPISNEEMNLASKEKLPLWTVAKETQVFPPEVLHLQTLARDSLMDFYDKSAGTLPVETELISTVDLNLQKIVFDSVRSKLDSYDAKRNSLERMGPANNDRSRIAEMEAQDITGEAITLIEDSLKALSEEKIDVVFLLKSGKTWSDSEFYFLSKNKILKEKSSIEGIADKEMLKPPGTLFFVSTEDPSCQWESREASADILPLPKPCLRILERTEQTQAVEKSVNQLIKIAFLKRMTTYSHREMIVPALFDPETRQLVVLKESGESATLDAIQLIEKHHNFFSSKVKQRQFQTGQVFWVSPVGESTYQLETPKLQAAVVVMDSETGEVYAQFGGYRPENSRFFDRSRVAKRQVGSTLKPWLYYLAADKGFTADSIIQNNGVAFPMKGKTYIPENFSKKNFGEFVPLSLAFYNSLNKSAVGLLTNPQFGPDRFENLKEFINFLVDIQIYNPKDLEVEPSIVLGSQEVSVLNITSSFTFFANGKYIVKPTFFRSIKNGQGVSLYQSSQIETISVPHSEDHFAIEEIQRLLIGNANNGTAELLLNFPFKTLGLKNCDGRDFSIVGQICFGGKTGTSSSSNDNWFIGTTRNFTIGVWVGYDSRESTGATGGELALPIFMEIIEKGQEYLPAIEPILTQ